MSVSSSGILNASLVEAQQFSLLVDVAGGAGSTLAAILEATPGLQGVLFDLAHVIECCRVSLTERGMAQRCRMESDSFFDAVPADGDGYFLKHIMHDWSDQVSLRGG
jgi:hypothetical protein